MTLEPKPDTQIDPFACARELEQENERIAKTNQERAPPRLPGVRHGPDRLPGRPGLLRDLRDRGKDTKPGGGQD